MNKKLIELIKCYIEQYDYDSVWGSYNCIDLITIIRLKEIIKNDK